MFGMIDLRMELHAIEAPLFVSDGDIRAGGAVGIQPEALRDLLHIIPMAHPTDAGFRKALEELAGSVKESLGLAVLSGGIFCGSDHTPPQIMRQKLTAVADPQHRHAQLEQLRVSLRRGGVVDAVGAAGKDHADGIHGPDFVHRRCIGLYLAVHAALPYPPGYELVILAPKVQHHYILMFHK